MSKSSIAFLALCFASVVDPFLERYGLINWSVAADTFLALLLAGGLTMIAALFIWSLLRVRRHKLLSLLGGLICAFSLWISFQNGKILY